MKITLLTFLIVSSIVAWAQNSTTGSFQYHTDIGHPKNKGSAIYDDATQTYTLMGSGYNIWFNRDEFQYLYNKMTGDFTLTANFEFVGNKGNNHRKYGWMIRESTDDAAAHVSAVAHGDGLTVMQWRVLKGAYMRDPQDEIFFPKKGAEVIQLQRAGNEISMRIAHAGEPLQLVGTYAATALPDAVLAGPYVCSHDSTATEQVKIWNVRINKAQAKDTNPAKKFELVTVADGKRKLVESLPDWSTAAAKKPISYTYQATDITGTSQIYRTKPDGSNKEQITFDEYQNLSPVVSPDGKWLAYISFPYNMDTKALYQWAMIRVLPLNGGAPKVIAYFYGSRLDAPSWSADSKMLSFTSYE